MDQSFSTVRVEFAVDDFGQDNAASCQPGPLSPLHVILTDGVEAVPPMLRSHRPSETVRADRSIEDLLLCEAGQGIGCKVKKTEEP